MKSYSSESISQDAAISIASEQAGRVQASLNEVDFRQTKQINQLRIWLAVSVAANAALSLALRFL